VLVWIQLLVESWRNGCLELETLVALLEVA